LVSRARVTRRLSGYRDRLPIDFEALYTVIMQLSQLIIDIPQVQELDINPLLADEKGVIALDARIKVAAVNDSTRTLSIRPYPAELEQTIDLDGMRLTLRPIRPEDETQHSQFLARIDAEDIQLRFLHAIGTLDHTQLARLTQIDYDREMAFIAVTDAHRGEPQTLGVVRAIADSDRTKAEFAILVRSDFKGKGLGVALLRKLVRYCREQGMSEIVGDVLRTNRRMLALAAELGFESGPGLEPALVRVRLTLTAPSPPA
ncbi:MAG: GNAT family N-acetyltransferase, partial [Pseudomonadota bacterium]